MIDFDAPKFLFLLVSSFFDVTKIERVNSNVFCGRHCLTIIAIKEQVETPLLDFFEARQKAGLIKAKDGRNATKEVGRTDESLKT